MASFMGIDGGGSNLRVVITDEHMNPLVQINRSTANPNVIGRDASRHLIQSTMTEALSEHTQPVVAVGIGIAGAAAHYASEWLTEVVHGVLPDICIRPSSDTEIALCGAHGKLEGILILAGTGSSILGINAAGQSLQVGGWGYLLGDEGSGYWVGMQALRTVIHTSDHQLQEASSLPQRVLQEIHCQKASDMIQWLYRKNPTPVSEVAKLSRIVLEEAESGDMVSHRIIQQAADDLARAASIAQQELDMEQAQFAFAGGLLEADNLLSTLVTKKLGLSAQPKAKYTPVVGAALLAKLHCRM